jgi:hypothetical protein
VIHFKKFNSIYYAFKKDCGKVGCWVISDRPDENGRVYYYNSDLFRIDQAIKSFKDRVFKKSTNKERS